MRNRKNQKRHAFTLVELSVSMSVGGALMILAIGLVHQSMSLASVGRQRSDQQRTFNRLAREFRHDVHRAVQCTVESPGRIQLIMPFDKLITYHAQGNRVTRQQPLADGRSRREAFELGADSMVIIESVDQPTRAVLSILRSSHGTIEKPTVIRKMAAVVGRLTVHENAEVSP